MIIVQIISQTLCHGLVMLMRMPHCSSSNTDTPLINTAQQEEQCLLSTLYFIWLHPCGGQCVWPTSLPPSPNFPSFSSLILFASFFFFFSSLDLTSVSAKVLFPLSFTVSHHPNTPLCYLIFLTLPILSSLHSCSHTPQKPNCSDLV